MIFVNGIMSVFYLYTEKFKYQHEKEERVAIYGGGCVVGMRFNRHGGIEQSLFDGYPIWSISGHVQSTKGEIQEQIASTLISQSEGKNT